MHRAPTIALALALLTQVGPAWATPSEVSAPDLPAVDRPAPDVCVPDDAIARRRVLVIGVDGVRPDALQAARAPNVRRLARTGTVSWDAEVTDITLSGPSWSALLTGVGVAKHGVVDNAFEDHALDRWPTIFERARRARPDAWLAAFVAWRPLQRFVLTTEILDRSAWRRDDDRVVAEATAALRRKDPLLTFVHLDGVDAAGHKHGYGPDNPRYMRAIAAADARVGELLRAVKRRKTRAAEDWLIVVTTDHGGTGYGHKDDLPTNRRVFVIAHGLGPAGSVFTAATPRLTDVAPTVLTWLGVPFAAAGEGDDALDGHALVVDGAPESSRIACSALPTAADAR